MEHSRSLTRPWSFGLAGWLCEPGTGFHVLVLSWARQAVLMLFCVSQLQEVVEVRSPGKA